MKEIRDIATKRGGGGREREGGRGNWKVVKRMANINNFKLKLLN